MLSRRCPSRHYRISGLPRRIDATGEYIMRDMGMMRRMKRSGSIGCGGVAYVIMLLALLVTPRVEGQLTNHSSVMNGMGNGSSIASTGGTFTNRSSGAQPGGVSVSTNGAMVNYAGFLGGFSLQPGLDTDGDGIEDELDNDNDNDAIPDGVELAGNAFDPGTATDPNIADTDGDGVWDGSEAAAGSNPTNENEFLHMVSVTPANGREVSWQARTGKVYRVLYSEGEHAGTPTNVLMVSTGAPPGAGQWAVTTNTITDLSATNQRSFAVEIIP